MLKSTDNQSYELLKELTKTYKTTEWQKFPKAIYHKNIYELEKLGFIFTKNLSEYVILNRKLPELVDKAEKS
jgi:hypothetical protein